MSIGHWTPWPSTDVATLRTMWADGTSAEIIAATLHVSRNAVIGKVHRLNLPGRQTVTRTPRRPPRERTVTLRPRTPERIHPGNLRGKREGRKHDPGLPIRTPPRADAKVKRSLKLTILEITETTCKWPSAEDHPPYTYCGHETFEGLPYCAAHCRVAYQSGSSQDARRRQAAKEATWAARQ